MNGAKFDYVIVGGGTAGCVLASRLTENSAIRVLVLEIGPDYRGLPIQVPAALGDLYEQGRYHWDYQSEAEPHANGIRLLYKMGRILGGSSAINGLVWVRGNRLDFDDWADLGCNGWSYEDVAPIFRRIESYEVSSDKAMGHSGPIPVVRGCPETQPLNAAFIAAARQAGYPINHNYNAGDQEGFCALQRNTHNGRRGDVYQGYLKPALKRPNLTIITGARAERLIIEAGVTRGVEYRLGDQLKRVVATREVLLTAGSLASPQLLELSGIGDPDVLNRNGVEVKHMLPGVGNHLHTHPTIKFTYDCPKPVSIYPATRFPGRWLAGLEWLLRRTGPAATNHFEAGAFLKTDPSLDRPDIELTFLPLALDSMTRSRRGHGFQVYVELIGCKSRGSTHICSTDIAKQPSFRFNYLAREQDLVAYRASIDIVRNLISQQAFDRYRGSELFPGAGVDTDPEIDDWLRHSVGLSHHLVGSCRMGPGDNADTVVGPDLKVHGIEHLRIADASIMPTITSANTHAAVIMIAEHASDMILSDLTNKDK